MIIKLDEILQLIPHRDPFLFVDQCQIVKNGFEGIGTKKFLESEYFFKGHFPKMPIVPGVVLIEAMAQTAGIVISKFYQDRLDKSVLFLSISSAKFRKPVYPNDEIQFSVKYINSVKSVYKFMGNAYKGDLKVCESQFSSMITYK